MSTVIPIKLTGAVPADYSVGFAWQQPGGLVTNVYGFDNTARWTQCYKNYEQYAITGLKLKWIPGNFVGTADPGSNNKVGSFTGPMFLYFDIDTFNTLGYSADQIVALDSSRVVQSNKVWKRYFGCKIISKQQNVKWQDTNGYAVATANGLTNASTALKFQYQGFDSTNTTVAYIKATWYVTFKGQAYQQ